MNKIFTLIAVALVGYTPIKAQNVKLGVRAGANISTLTNFSSYRNTPEKIDTSEITTGLRMGGYIGSFIDIISQNESQ